jgi:hypothetical protein
LNTEYTYQIVTESQYLPNGWDSIAQANIFLSKKYLEVLESAAPANISCQYIGIFNQEELIGIALAQFIDLSHLESYGERDKKLKTCLKEIILAGIFAGLTFSIAYQLVDFKAYGYHLNIKNLLGAGKKSTVFLDVNQIKKLYLELINN